MLLGRPGQDSHRMEEAAEKGIKAQKERGEKQQAAGPAQEGRKLPQTSGFSGRQAPCSGFSPASPSRLDTKLAILHKHLKPPPSRPKVGIPENVLTGLLY